MIKKILPIGALAIAFASSAWALDAASRRAQREREEHRPPVSARRQPTRGRKRVHDAPNSSTASASVRKTYDTPSFISSRQFS